MLFDEQFEIVRKKYKTVTGKEVVVVVNHCYDYHTCDRQIVEIFVDKKQNINCPLSKYDLNKQIRNLMLSAKLDEEEVDETVVSEVAEAVRQFQSKFNGKK